jgi:hypothetical protein
MHLEQRRGYAAGLPAAVSECYQVLLPSFGLHVGKRYDRRPMTSVVPLGGKPTMAHPKQVSNLHGGSITPIHCV